MSVTDGVRLRERTTVASEARDDDGQNKKVCVHSCEVHVVCVGVAYGMCLVWVCEVLWYVYVL